MPVAVPTALTAWHQYSPESLGRARPIRMLLPRLHIYTEPEPAHTRLPSVGFLAFVHLALFLAFSPPGNSLVFSLCDHSMLACMFAPPLCIICESLRNFVFVKTGNLVCCYRYIVYLTSQVILNRVQWTRCFLDTRLNVVQ